MRMVRRFIFLQTFLLVFLSARSQDQWLTYFEKSGGKETPRYAETLEYCRNLDKASPWIKYSSFGTSPQGRELPLVILSKDRAFTPAAAAKTGKPVILIQSGIHSGEIDGKDASLMLMRDIAITKKYAFLLDHTILLFVPIFSVDGHERFGPFNRINQNGPEQMGWRTTAQNLNLNRDYVKADAPEMRSMLRLFSSWLPDFAVDCHVTDGIDVQYDITYAIDTGPLMDPGIVSWITRRLLPESLPKVEAAGHKIFYYVFPREDNDLSKGLTAGSAPPRFSTGYGAIQNRPFLLVETHMLKPYKTRVEATYHFLKAMIGCINGAPEELRRAVRNADQATIAAGQTYAPDKTLPLTTKLGERSRITKFLGIESTMEQSDLSGSQRRVYTGKPMEVDVPFLDEVLVQGSAPIPLAYFIPPEWTFVSEVLRAHSVVMERLTEPVTLSVQSYRFSDVAFRGRPYEGRQTATYSVAPIEASRTFPRGTLVVRTNQRAAKVAMHLLEPKSPDSFTAWGFFNVIFEQKEYAESYVMEEVGKKMLAENSGLRQEFEQKVKSDTAFAKSPDDRLNWLYLHSQWSDPWLNVYPVGRVVTNSALKTEIIR